MKFHLVLPVLASILISCYNTKEPEAQIQDPCASYNKRYDSLHNLTNSLDLENPYLGQLLDAELDIKQYINNLKNDSCPNDKDISFAVAKLRMIDSLKVKVRIQIDLEIKEGVDRFMDGIEVTNHEITYSENMEPTMEIEVNNITKISIKSIMFQLQYCDKKKGQGIQERDDPDCYEDILVKGPYKPFSKTKCYAPINSEKYENTRERTYVVIKQLVKEDGRLVKRLDHKGF